MKMDIFQLRMLQTQCILLFNTRTHVAMLISFDSILIWRFFSLLLYFTVIHYKEKRTCIIRLKCEYIKSV